MSSFSQVFNGHPQRDRLEAEAFSAVIDPVPLVRQIAIGNLDYHLSLLGTKLIAGFAGDRTVMIMLQYPNKYIETLYVDDIPDEYDGQPIESTFPFDRSRAISSGK